MPTDTGKVVQVLGNVVDVEFTPETLPNINDALKVQVNEDSRPSTARDKPREMARRPISAERRWKRAS